MNPTFTYVGCHLHKRMADSFAMMSCKKIGHNAISAIHFEPLGRTHFLCEGTADGRNCKWRLRFRSEGLTAAFRKFSRAL